MLAVANGEVGRRVPVDPAHHADPRVRAPGATFSKRLRLKTVVTAICISAAVDYLPLIGVASSLNFPYWDAMMVPFLCFKPPHHTFGPILANLRYSVFAD